MVINNVVVRTPFRTVGDDPTWYDPMWRARIGTICGSIGVALPDTVKDDPYIKMAYDYNLAIHEGMPPDTLARKFYDYHIALGWSERREGNPTRFQMDAMLLCPSNFARLVELIRLPYDLIRMYEQCFYNVRAIDDTPPSMCTLYNLGIGVPQRITEASPADLQMRARGIGTPIETLMLSWGMWLDPDISQPEMTIYNMATAELTYLIRTRQLNGEDLCAIMGHGLTYAKQKAEDTQEKSNDGWSQLTDLMHMFAPRLLVARRTDLEMRDQQKALERKLLIDGDIKKTVIEDRGPTFSSGDFGKALQQALNVAELPKGVVLDGEIVKG